MQKTSTSPNKKTKSKKEEVITQTYIIDETRKPWTIGYTIAFSISLVVGVFAIFYTMTGIIYKMIT